WVRALERTAPIERNPHRTLPVVIEELAGRYGSAPALASPEGTLTYETLAQTANRYARWALAEGLAPGDVVCLLLENCPDYLAIWLGLTRVGVTVALLNTHLTGEPLRHTREMRIEEGHRDAHPSEAEPDRQVVRAVLEQQADDVARRETLG